MPPRCGALAAALAAATLAAGAAAMDLSGVEVVPDPELIVSDSKDGVGLAAAEEVGRIIRAHQRKHTRNFTMAISGGSLPALLNHGITAHAHEFVSRNAGKPDRADPGAEILAVDWKRVAVFYADERHVALDNIDSNHALCQQQLWTKLPVEPGNVHTIDPDLPVEAAASEYEAEVLKVVEKRASDGVPVFDLVLLGMGPDGHTASLFPGHALLHGGTGRVVEAVKDSPKPPAERVTLTLPVIKAAHRIVFVVTGAGKARAVREALEMHSQALPAGLVRPDNGHRTWFVDKPAAADLDPFYLEAHQPLPRPPPQRHEDL